MLTTIMKKETLIKVAVNSCFLLPGNIQSRKTWFLSIPSVLSLIGLGLAIFSCVNEFTGYRKMVRNVRKNGVMFSKLKILPPRHVAECVQLKEIGGSQQIGGEQPGQNYPPEFGILSQSNDSIDGPQVGPPPPPKPELLEEIVGTSYRVLIFASNIIIRLFIWRSFPSIVEIFSCVFKKPEQEEVNRADSQGSLVRHIWYEGATKWSTCEKIFLAMVIFSQLQRELELIFMYSWPLSAIGIDNLSIPCLLLQLVLEQAKIMFSRELVLEVTTFVLLVIIHTFSNVLWTVAGDPLEVSNEEGDDEDRSNDLVDGKELRRRSGGKKSGTADFLFVRAQAMILHSDKINSGLPSDTKNFMLSPANDFIRSTSAYGSNPDLSMIFRTSSHNQSSMAAKYGSSGARGITDMIYSRMNFILSMYFDSMAVWERCSKITGFVTLLLFCELTTTFCLNTYTILDNSTRFGMFSGMGICGILRGIIIVVKLICVCNAAQALNDMTQILIDRILKLKLKLLSLPKELYRHKGSSRLDEGLASGPVAEMCERCRGLGSFLTEVVSYIRNHPFELSALGYFSVSRSSLTTITGVIVTYLVVLVQFQSYSSTSSSSASTAKPK